MLSDVKRLVVNKGDTLVVYLKEHLSPEAYQQLVETYTRFWKEQKIRVIILDAGMDIGVLGK